MPTYTFTDYSDTIIKVTEDTREYLYKKVYCSTFVDGNYLLFCTHQVETGLFKQQYAVLYSDCTAPSEASAADLKIAVDAIIDTYAGGGGGGGVPTSRTISTTSPLTGGGDLSANRTIAIPAANGSTNGYLTSADWTTFNSKQAAIGFTPENAANKATDLTSPDNTKYPTTLAVSNSLATAGKSINIIMAHIAAN